MNSKKVYVPEDVLRFCANWADGNGFRWSWFYDAPMDMYYFKLRRQTVDWYEWRLTAELLCYTGVYVLNEIIRDIPLEMWLDKQAVNTKPPTKYNLGGIVKSLDKTTTVLKESEVIMSDAHAALQAATAGIVEVENEKLSPLKILASKFDLDQDSGVCPVEGCKDEEGALRWLIIHLNDLHHWDRNTLADWLEASEFNINMKGKQ